MVPRILLAARGPAMAVATGRAKRGGDGEEAGGDGMAHVLSPALMRLQGAESLDAR